MAKRSTRQRIIDKLVATMRELDKAENNLAQVSAKYFEVGEPTGALIDEIRKSITTIRETVKDFRYTRA